MEKVRKKAGKSIPRSLEPRQEWGKANLYLGLGVFPPFQSARHGIVRRLCQNKDKALDGEEL